MSRETLKSFLAANGYTSQQISYVVADKNGSGALDTGDDLGIDPGTGRELLGLDGSARGLVGDYLKYISENFNNFFPMQGGNEQAPSTNRGSSLQPAQDSGAQNVFAPSDGYGLNMGTYSNSGKFDQTDTALNTIINKTQGEGGNTLLPEITGQTADAQGRVVVNTPDDLTGRPGVAVKQILKNYNRFNPSGFTGTRPFVERTATSGDVDSTPVSSEQRDFGKNDLNADGITLDQLKNIAGSLILKSAGYDNGDNPSVSKSPDDSIDQVPSNIGSEQYTYRLRADRAYGAPETETGGSYRSGRGDFFGFDPNADNSKTYGSLTTPSTPFYSMDSNSTLVLASAYLKTIVKRVSETLPEILGRLNPAVNVDLGKGPYYKGYSTNVSRYAKYEMAKRTTLIPTIYPYGDAVNAGLLLLFGAKNGDTPASSTQTVYESPGFWLSVARGVIRSVSIMSSEIYTGGSDIPGETDKDRSRKILEAIRRSKIIGFMNTLATVGDILLQATGGVADPSLLQKKPLQYDVDAIPDGPAARISKSRSKDGTSGTSLAWRNGSVPSLFMLSGDSINAASRMNSQIFGASPARAMLASRLFDKTYVDRRLSTDETSTGQGIKRIPQEVVKIVEDRLDAEYVPFYFHDLRTNEIIGFHAFLETLSDSYSPQFNSSRGFGRIDDVQTYSRTSRTISLSFRVVGTSKEDFDEMWFKINKLVTLAYPQWSAGKLVGGGRSSLFRQPFSQVIASSPVIRLRIGDVVKTNYSKFNLAKIFGIGGNSTEIKTPASFSQGLRAISSAVSSVTSEAFYFILGSPLQYFTNGTKGPLGALSSFLSNLLVNGFANPIGYRTLMTALADPDLVGDSLLEGDPSLAALSAVSSQVPSLGDISSKFALKGLPKGSFCYIKANAGKDYIYSAGDFTDKILQGGFPSADDSSIKRIRLSRQIRGLVTSRRVISLESPTNAQQGSAQRGFSPSGQSSTKTYYIVKIIDPGADPSIFGRNFLVTHSDVIADPRWLWSIAAAIFSPFDSVVEIANQAARSTVAALGVDPSAVSGLENIIQSPENDFMSSTGNAITRAFESNSGRGLAGVITSMQFNWIGSDAGMWETEWNSRAPTACRVTLNFTVIHDISPGIDNSGMNRAPNYNVGDIMQAYSGDSYNDNGEVSRNYFTAAGSHANKRIK